MIRRWQEKLYKTWGLHFIHASDEWYLLAEEPIPEEESYDGYLQLENGVGMLRLLEEEVEQELEERSGDDREIRISLATGKLAAPTLERLMQRIRRKYPKVQVKIYPIRNDFFGEMITVSGLITGQDLIAQLKDQPLGETLLLPAICSGKGKMFFWMMLPWKMWRRNLASGSRWWMNLERIWSAQY